MSLQRLLGLAPAAPGGTAFTDDFNDNSLDAAKWGNFSWGTGGDIAFAESSQQARFTADASYGGSINGRYLESVPIFDFTNKTIEIDLVSTTGLGQAPASASGNSSLFIADTANSNNRAMISVDQVQMLYRRSNNGANSQFTEVYATHQTKWRIQHDNSTNVWKFYYFSSSSGTWSLRFTSAAANWNPTSVKIFIECYIYGSNQVNRTTIFDNLVSDATY